MVIKMLSESKKFPGNWQKKYSSKKYVHWQKQMLGIDKNAIFTIKKYLPI